MAHEALQRDSDIESSSDRSFGLVFAGLFAIIALWPLFSDKPIRWWSLGAATAFAFIALAAPSLLAQPNRLWTRFGLLLGKVVSPIAIAILLYGVFTPIGLLMRLFGKDPLRLRIDPDATSYWIKRAPPGPAPNSMNNQF